MLLRFSVRNDIVARRRRVYIFICRSITLDAVARQRRTLVTNRPIYIYIIRGHTINFLPHRTFRQITLFLLLISLISSFSLERESGDGFLCRMTIPNALSPRFISSSRERKREKRERKREKGRERKKEIGSYSPGSPAEFGFSRQTRRHRQEKKRKRQRQREMNECSKVVTK